jgi:hypothetical protein
MELDEHLRLSHATIKAFPKREATPKREVLNVLGRVYNFDFGQNFGATEITEIWKLSVFFEPELYEGLTNFD